MGIILTVSFLKLHQGEYVKTEKLSGTFLTNRELCPV